MRENDTRAVEMTGPGKRGKPTPGFPRFPPPLEIAPRFPHSHRLEDCYFLSPNNLRKEPRYYHPFPFPSGSFFDEKMLGLQSALWLLGGRPTTSKRQLPWNPC